MELTTSTPMPKDNAIYGVVVDLILGLNRNGGRFLGIARRSPIMANGQLPGVPREYTTEYAKRLDLVRQRFGSAL